MRKAKTLDGYLSTLSTERRAPLEKLRRTIRSLVPNAEECISYGIPAFRVEGKVVGGFAATKKGYSYFPFSGSTLATLAVDLEAYSQTKSALHFDAKRPLKATLVKKLIQARRAEIAAATRAER